MPSSACWPVDGVGNVVYPNRCTNTHKTGSVELKSKETACPLCQLLLQFWRGILCPWLGGGSGGGGLRLPKDKGEGWKGREGKTCAVFHLEKAMGLVAELESPLQTF